MGTCTVGWNAKNWMQKMEEYVASVLDSTQNIFGTKKPKNSLGFVVVIIDAFTPNLVTAIFSNRASLFYLSTLSANSLRANA